YSAVPHRHSKSTHFPYRRSSDLGTYQTAKMIEQEVKEEYPEAKFEVINTKCASIGYGLVVLRAAKLAQEGASIEEIIEIASYHRSEEHTSELQSRFDIVCGLLLV